MSRRSSRRALSGLLSAALVAALTLVFSGLGIAPASAVAPSVVVTSTPSPAAPNAENSFSVAITNHDTGTLKSLAIVLPAGFSAINTVSISPSAHWGAQLDQANRTIKVALDDNSVQLQNGDTLTVTFKATTPAAGSAAFAVTTWSNANLQGSGVDATGGSVSIGKLNQTISFTSIAPSDARFGGSYNATAQATSNLAVTLGTDTSSVCTVSSTGAVNFVGVGTCHVNANQAGDATYNAAPQVQQSFSVDKADQTVSITPVATQTFSAGATVDVTASATSGLPVSLGVTGPCSIEGSTITLTGAGVCHITGDQAGNANYNHAQQATSQFTINKGTATIALTTGEFTYDGQQHAASVTTVPDDLSDVEIIYDTSTTDPTTTPPTDAGSYDVTATLTNDDYEAEPQYGTLVIHAKHVTGSFTAEDKTYDGGTDATISGCSLPDEDHGGILDSDAANVAIDCDSATGTFDSKNAGSRNVSLTGAMLTGSRSGNYVLDGVADANATINQAEVTATIDAGDKTYDCSTDVDLVNGISANLSGVLDGDVDVQIDSASFDSAGVGTTHAVTAQVSLTGTAADVANYVLASGTVADSPVTIFARPLVGGFIADDKVYDGTDAATVAPNALTGIVCDEDVTLSVTGAHFIPDGDAGIGKTVTGTLVLGGDDAGNYVLDITSSDTDTADIARRPVVGSFTAADRTWAAGDVSATIVTRNLGAVSGDPDSGPITGDDVSLSGGVATFANPDAATDKTVTVPATGPNAFTLAGAKAGNYSLVAGPWTATAAILPLYRGAGFYQPVDMPTSAGIVWNTIKGGQTVPLKFDIYNATTGAEQSSLSVFGADATAQAKAFSVKEVACQTGSSVSVDDIELVTTGGTALRYDGTAPSGQYIQNWKTPTTAGKCYSVTVKTVDGSTVGPAYFQIKK